MSSSGHGGFVKVVENATSEIVELPVEDDDTLLLTTLRGQFPNAAGLRYRSSSGAWRGVRISGDALNPPQEGWGCDTIRNNIVYQVISACASNIRIKNNVVRETQQQVNQQLRTPCIFFRSGFCKSGSTCKWLHPGINDNMGGKRKTDVPKENEEIPKKVYKKHLTVLITSPNEGMETNEVKKDGDSRNLCRYFKIGLCKVGLKCRFLHPGVNDKDVKGKEKMDDPVKEKDKDTVKDTVDLIVSNVPVNCTSDNLKLYLGNTCGDLKYCKVSPKSTLGYVKFQTVDGEKAALTGYHLVMGSRVTINVKKLKEVLYVGRVGVDVSVQDIKDYFSQFAEVNNVYLPHPSRNFAFVTLSFASLADFNSTLSKEHKVRVRGKHKIEEVKWLVKKAGSRDEILRRKAKEDELSKEADKWQLHESYDDNLSENMSGVENGDERKFRDDTRDLRKTLDNMNDTMKDMKYNMNDIGGSMMYNFGDKEGSVRDMSDKGCSRKDNISDMGGFRRDNMGGLRRDDMGGSRRDNTSDMGCFRRDDMRRYSDDISSSGNCGIDNTQNMRGTQDDLSNISNYGDKRRYSDSISISASYGNDTANNTTSLNTRGTQDKFNVRHGHRDDETFGDNGSTAKRRRRKEKFNEKRICGNEAVPITSSQNTRVIQDKLNDAGVYRDDKRYNNNGNVGALDTVSQLMGNSTEIYSDSNRIHHIYENDSALLSSLSPMEQPHDLGDRRNDLNNRNYSENNKFENNVNDAAPVDVNSQLKYMIYSILTGR